MEDEELSVDDAGHLDVRYRGWTSIDTEIWKFIDQLVSLDISFNNISSLPNQIGDLRHLADFNCSCNQIEALPTSVGNLRRLKVLKANGNALTFLPKEIGNCINLQTLHLSENQLEFLPDTLVGCIGLSIVKLQNNHLKQLPPNLAELKDTIEEFDATNNSYLHMIPHDMRGNTAAIMWTLSIHNEKSIELSKLQRATKEMRQLLQSSEEKTAIFKEFLTSQNEQKKRLLLERKSINWYLFLRDSIKKFSARIKLLSLKCNNLFERRVSKVSCSG